MVKKAEPPGRIRIRVLFPGHSGVSKMLKRTLEKLSTMKTAILRFNKDKVRPVDRVEEAPELAWTWLQGSANEKQSYVLVNLQLQEEKKLLNELAKSTLPDKIRQEKATADKIEAEARMMEMKEIQARLELFEKLRQMGILMVKEDDKGTVSIIKVRPDCDWGKAAQQLFNARELELLLSSSSQNREEDDTREQPPA